MWTAFCTFIDCKVQSEIEDAFNDFFYQFCWAHKDNSCWFAELLIGILQLVGRARLGLLLSNLSCPIILCFLIGLVGSHGKQDLLEDCCYSCISTRKRCTFTSPTRMETYLRAPTCLHISLRASSSRSTQQPQQQPVYVQQPLHDQPIYAQADQSGRIQQQHQPVYAPKHLTDQPIFAQADQSSRIQ